MYRIIDGERRARIGWNANDGRNAKQDRRNASSVGDVRPGSREVEEGTYTCRWKERPERREQEEV